MTTRYVDRPAAAAAGAHRVRPHPAGARVAAASRASSRYSAASAVLFRVGSRGSRLALTQAERAAEALAPAGVEIALVPITTAGDRDRTKPFGADRRARRLRQGARGGAARRADRRRGPLREGHDLDGHGRARRRRLSRRGRIRATRSAGSPSSGRGCGSARPRCGAGRSCWRSSRRSRSSRCAATSTRGCASAASAGSTRSCWRPAGSTGSVSRARSATASSPSELLPEAGQGALALQVRAGEEELVARADDAETRRRVEAERRCVALSAVAASRRSPRTTTARR